MNPVLKISEKKPLVSLIIPVYNVEPYLRRCLDSVIDQTFDSYEVFLVDDGSTDACPSIIAGYAARDPRFIPIYMEKNQGTGVARNTALQRVRGEFVTFVDSDDYVAPNFLERMVREAESKDADIVMCQYQIFWPNGRLLFRHLGRNETLTRKKALSRLYRDMTVHHFLCNKLYRHSLFIKSNFSVPSMIFEDIACNHELFHHADKIVFVKDILYNYCRRDNSNFTAINYRRLDDNVKALRMILRYLSDNQVLPDYRAPFNFSVTRNIITMTVDILLLHRQKQTSGLWADWVHYWGLLNALYTQKPERARRKNKKEKQTAQF